MFRLRAQLKMNQTRRIQNAAEAELALSKTDVSRGMDVPGGANGAQGRDRTTDTAIFSRMLYQLSYLGTSSREGLGAAVYSQAGKLCPPRFALRATRGAAVGSGVCP